MRRRCRVSYARLAFLVASKGRIFLFLLFFCFFPFIHVPLSSLSLSFIYSTISSISFLPFSGRRPKMTHKVWLVGKPQHNQKVTGDWSQSGPNPLLSLPLTYPWRVSVHCWMNRECFSVDGPSWTRTRNLQHRSQTLRLNTRLRRFLLDTFFERGLIWNPLFHETLWSFSRDAALLLSASYCSFGNDDCKEIPRACDTRTLIWDYKDLYLVWGVDRKLRPENHYLASRGLPSNAKLIAKDGFCPPALAEWVRPSVCPSVHTNEYLGGCIWRVVSMYLNGIYSVIA